MNLRRQLLLVSLLTLILPWAGCEFIRETESALRTKSAANAGRHRESNGQLDGAIHRGTIHRDSASRRQANQIFRAHTARSGTANRRLLRRLGFAIVVAACPERSRMAQYASQWHHSALRCSCLSMCSDRKLVYASGETLILDDGPRVCGPQSVSLTAAHPIDERSAPVFAAEAPGSIISYKLDSSGIQARRNAHCSLMAGYSGCTLLGRLSGLRPESLRSLLGTNLGVVISNTNDSRQCRYTGCQLVRQYARSGRSDRSQSCRQSRQCLHHPGTARLLTDACRLAHCTARVPCPNKRPMRRSQMHRDGRIEFTTCCWSPANEAQSAEPGPQRP